MSKDEVITFRVGSREKEGFQEICEEHGINPSDLMRHKMREIVIDGEEHIPSELVAQARINHSQEMQNAKQKVMHYPQNFDRQVANWSQDRFRPHPKHVREAYVEPYKESIDTVFGDGRGDRYKAQLESSLQNYRMIHPQTRGGSEESFKSVVDIALGIRERDDYDTAKSFIKDMVDEGIIPESRRDRAYDIVRDAQRSEWTDKWDTAVRGDS